jgi:rhodanese-related sulfurtransferase
MYWMKVMSKGVIVNVFVVLFLFAGAATLWAAPINISASDAQELLRRPTPPYLLDVRTAGEYMQVRIPGATLIPIDQFVARMAEVPRNQPVLVYCAVGSRSSQVADYLVRQGYPEVYNMTGGIMGWQLRGLPVLKGAP